MATAEMNRRFIVPSSWVVPIPRQGGESKRWTSIFRKHCCTRPRFQRLRCCVRGILETRMETEQQSIDPIIEPYMFAWLVAAARQPELPALEPQTEPESAWIRMGQEIVAGVQTLVSAAVYATLIVTFGFQVARVDGLSMAPTLEDHDRLIVNKLVYELGDPRPGDIVMLYYPVNPEKMFVKRVIAKEGDTVRIVDGRVYVNERELHDAYVHGEFPSHDDWGRRVVQQG